MTTRVTEQTLKIGGRYYFAGWPDVLVYIRKFNNWHQFELEDEPGKVWCEVLPSNINLFREAEKTEENKDA